MGKEGKGNIKFIVSVLFLLSLMAFFVFSFGVEYRAPGNITINTSLSRNINFTFTPTWNRTGEVVGNCSLWTNFSGAWASMVEFNGTAEGIYRESSNITNGTLSWINYTFTRDLSGFAWTIACRNGTQEAAELNFSAGNRTLAIDTQRPVILQTNGSIFITNVWNTSSANPVIYFNITDLNGTGINLTQNSYNNTLNVTVYNASSSTPLKIYNISNSSLTCSGIGTDSVTSTQCTLTFDTFSLTNGTKAINISVSDNAGWNSNISFNITVDQIPPALLWINLTNASTAFSAVSVLNGTGSLRQGQILYLSVNLTDNLTQPSNISLEWLNTTDGTNVWNQVAVQPVNNTNPDNSGARQYYWGNASFTIPTGRNEFEGRNVSFRAVYSDILGNSNYSITKIVQINDTYEPTIEITLPAANVTNLSTTTLTVNWSINENNALAEINISVDGVGINTGADDGCNKYKRYTPSGATLVNAIRNGSWSTTGGGTCGLTNGSHYVVVQATDVWGNSFEDNRTFNVQSGTKPGLAFNLTSVDRGAPWIKTTVNSSNITSVTGIGLYGMNALGAIASIDKIAYISSCNTTGTIVVTNYTVVYPFNTTSQVACGTTSANRTLTVTINDTAGNSNTTVLGFMVDNVGPTIAVHSPAAGFSTAGKIEVNVSAFDGESQIQWIGYYLDGGVTLLNHTLKNNESVLTGTFGQNTTSINRTINFTAGTHRIKISVNDTLGNIRNSSEITFTYRGPFNFLEVNKSLRTAVPTNTNYSNVSIFNASGILLAGRVDVDQTLEIFLALNGSGANINVSINFNGSAANWDELNFTPKLNDTSIKKTIEDNFTARIVELISFNSSTDGASDSIDEFIPDASYYGFVDFTLNATNMTSKTLENGRLGGIAELWYFENETTLNSKVNITECAVGSVFSHISATPCWNNTDNATVRVYVPHFSAIALVNDSMPPNVTSVNTPATTQDRATFVPNITVTNDVAICNSSYSWAAGGSTFNSSNATMTIESQGTSKICYGSSIDVFNGTTSNNITFYVWDGNGNLNVTQKIFDVADITPHNLSSVVNSTTGSTTWKLIITANESVNVTVRRSTSAEVTATTNTSISGFSRTQYVNFTGLSASTVYYFNVTTCDKAGNCLDNGTYQFTTSAAEAAAAAAAAAASSGGGGGGAVPPTTVAASQAQVWQTVPAGTSFSLKVDKATIAITSVAVNEVKSELKNVEIEAAALTENPVSTEAAAKVYQYIRITKKNLADTDAGSLKVGFRVTKAWLTENSLASGDIALYRYKDDKWNELATKVTGTDDTYVNYEAQTPGFSSFAVGTKSGVVVEEAPAEEAPAEEVPEEEAAPPEAVEAPKGVEAPSKAPTAWIIAAVVVILGIILIVAYQKKKQKV